MLIWDALHSIPDGLEDKANIVVLTEYSKRFVGNCLGPPATFCQENVPM